MTMSSSYHTQSTLLNGSFSEHLATGKMPQLSLLIYSVLFVFLLIRLLFAYLLGPGFDEAYYYGYSLRPALSYFDHPPLVSFFAGLFPKITGVHTIFTSRLGVVLLFTISGYFFAKLCRLFLNEKETVVALILLNSIPIFLVCAGMMILPDGAMSFFWVASLYYYWKILHLPYKLGNWLTAGFLSGCVMLAKYHGILLILFLVCYVLLYRRDLFRRFGPYLFVVMALIAFSPVIIWNWQNEFVSFLFQGQRAIGTEISFSDFFQAVGGQAAYLTPFIFFHMFYIMFKCSKDALWHRDIRAKFFFFFGVGPVCFFMGISLVRQILPHWPLAGYIVLVIPLAYMVTNQWERSKRWRKYYTTIFIVTFSLYGLLLAQANYGILHLEKLVSYTPITEEDVRGDATLDTYGWPELDKYLSAQEFDGGKPFLFTRKWYMSGEVDLATRGEWDVFCFNRFEANAYADWAKGVDLVGRDAIFITTDRHFTDPTKMYKPYFDEISAPEVIEIYRGGFVAKKFLLYRCKNLKQNFTYN